MIWLYCASKSTGKLYGRKNRIELGGFFLYKQQPVRKYTGNDPFYNKKKKDKTSKNIFHNNCAVSIWKKALNLHWGILIIFEQIKGYIFSSKKFVL